MTRSRGRDAGPTSQASGLLANAGALVMSRIMIAALGWLGTVLIVRTLSIDDFGRFTFIFGVLGVLSIVTDPGIGRVAVTGLIRGTTDRARFVGSYILLRSVLGLVGYVLAIGFVAASGYSADVVGATAVAGVVVLLATPSRAYETVFQAQRRLRGVALTRALSRVGQLAFTAAIAAAGGSLLLFTIPAIFAEVVLLSWVAPAAHRLVKIKYRFDLVQWRALLREAAPLSAATALATIYYRVDTIMLSQMDGFAAVAIYGVAYKFVDLAHAVPEALSAASLPLLVGAWPERVQAFRETIRRSGTLLMLVGSIVLVEFTLFAESVIRFLYSETYVVGAGAARIVVVSECIAFATSLGLVVLISTSRHRRYPLIALAGLIVNVGLNLVLIPEYSFRGAAIATLATDVVVASWIMWEVRRIPGLSPFPRPPILRVLAAAAAAAGAGLALQGLLPWPVCAIVVVAVFGAAVVGLRAAGPGGLSALRRDSGASPGGLPDPIPAD